MMMLRGKLLPAAAAIVALVAMYGGNATAGAEAGCNDGSGNSSFTLAAVNGSGWVTNENDAWRFRVKRNTNDALGSPTTWLNAYRAGGATISNATSNLNTWTGVWSTNYSSMRTSEQVIMTGAAHGHVFDYNRSCTKV